MKRLMILACVSMSVLSWMPPAGAASADTYQVTGPIVKLDDKVIVVEKGKERWEIARDSDTKVEGDLKVGSKVTVKYRMTATKIETKGPAKAEKSDKAEDKAEKKN